MYAALIILPLLGWLAGLVTALNSRRRGLQTTIFLSAIGACAFFLATTSSNHQWASWIYLAAAGTITGAIGPTLLKGDKIMSIGVSVILAPCLMFLTVTLLFSAGCAWSGQCL